MTDFWTKDIQHFFTQKILSCELLGSGCSNDAYLIQTNDAKKYVAKRARNAPEHKAQNTLFLEAKLLEFLSPKHLCIFIPKIVFLSENPDMYGYEYIPGMLLTKIWEEIHPLVKISISKQLWQFHAELGKNISRKESWKLWLNIDLSPDLHPESLEDLRKIHGDPDIPGDIKHLALSMRKVLENTFSDLHFQFLHNDAHHENILVADAEITGFIDFWEAEYGEITKEFSRYIRDFPDYWQYIVQSYEEHSWNMLSCERLISYSFLAGLIDNIEMWKKWGEKRDQANKNIMWYKNALKNIS